MAISTDSFGSPGLGEGIGLQGTLKDYTPLIAKNRMAQQAMAGKAAQKKLDKELEQQAELSDTMKGFKPIGGLPAFHMERQRISAELWNKATELRKVGQPLKGNVEWEKAKMAAQDRFNQLKFVEDRYTPGITSVASKAVNFDEYELNEPLMAALNNPDESDYLRLSGGKLTYAGELLSPYAKVDIDTYAKKLSDRVKPKVSMLDNVLVQQYQGVNDKAAFIEDQIKKAYEPTEVENAINQFKNSSEMMNWLDREERRFAKTGVAFDRNAAMDRQAALLRSSFQDEQRRVLKQLFESKANSLSAGGKQPNKLVNLIAGSTGYESYVRDVGFPSYKADLKNKLKEDQKLFDSTNGDEGSSWWDKLDLSDDMKPDEIYKKIEEYNSDKPYSSAASKEQLESLEFKYPLNTLESIQKTADKIIKNRKALYFTRTDPGLNKYFNLVSPSQKNPVEAKPIAMIENKDGKYMFLAEAKVDRKIKGTDGKEKVVKVISLMEFPFEKNANTIGGEFSLSEQEWIEWFKLKQQELEETGKGTGSKGITFGGQKKEGGLVEPKEISKKFHDKSKNMTKFVYSDGSEEIFKGLL
jgi:hypothetical protein